MMRRTRYCRRFSKSPPPSCPNHLRSDPVLKSPCARPFSFTYPSFVIQHPCYAVPIQFNSRQINSVPGQRNLRTRTKTFGSIAVDLRARARYNFGSNHVRVRRPAFDDKVAVLTPIYSHYSIFVFLLLLLVLLWQEKKIECGLDISSVEAAAAAAAAL